MTETKRVRDIAVDADTKARLENAAWKQRSNISELTREVVQAALDGKLDDAPVPDGPKKGKGQRVRVGVVMTDELWEAFGEKAWRLRSSRVRLVQAGVAKLFGDVPIDRKEVQV